MNGPRSAIGHAFCFFWRQHDAIGVERDQGTELCLRVFSASCCCRRRHRLASPPASADDWPSRPLSMVVPFAAGSASDTVGRILAAGLATPLGQQVIVENVGGAGGMTGIARVTNAAPDGYQFVAGSVDTMAISQTLYKKPLYNSKTDFTPVGLDVEQPIILIARADLPANTLQEFIAYAKANGARCSSARPARLGIASRLLAAERRDRRGDHAYPLSRLGAGDAGSGGGTHRFLSARSAPRCRRRSRAKTAKAIANLTRERSPLFPNIPTRASKACPASRRISGAASSSRRRRPNRSSRECIEATEKALNDPATQERLKNAGVSVVAPERRSTDYLKTFVDSEIADWAATIKASGVASISSAPAASGCKGRAPSPDRFSRRRHSPRPAHARPTHAWTTHCARRDASVRPDRSDTRHAIGGQMHGVGARPPDDRGRPLAGDGLLCRAESLDDRQVLVEQRPADR